MKQLYQFITLFAFTTLQVQATFAQNADSARVSGDTDTSSFQNLLPVTVRTHTYKADSIQNRIDQKDIFNFKKKKINMGNNKWSESMLVMGKRIKLDTRNKKVSLLDIHSLAHYTYSKKDKQKLTLQKHLIEEEQKAYVEQIFTTALVERFSNMHNDDSLRMFVQKYAPAYNQILNMNELDLGNYILINMKQFKKPSLPVETIGQTKP